MVDYNRELEIINAKISNDERLIKEFQKRGISAKKIERLKLLKEHREKMRDDVLSKLG